MEEEIKKEEVKSEATLIEKAETVAKRIEEANKVAQEILERNEKIIAEDKLAGRSSAGTQAPIVDKEQAEKDRLNKILSGTGLTV